MNKAPANVDPIILNNGLDLNVFDKIGIVPTKETIAKNKIMKTIFRIAVIVLYYIWCFYFCFIINSISLIFHFLLIWPNSTTLKN